MSWDYTSRLPPSKYHARKTVLDGVQYHSQKEAKYAGELMLRVRCGELKSWRAQVPIDLTVKGKKICTYTIDFVEMYPNGEEMWTEVKGFETEAWRLKWKLFCALYPERHKQIVY